MSILNPRVVKGLTFAPAFCALINHVYHPTANPASPLVWLIHSLRASRFLRDAQNNAPAEGFSLVLHAPSRSCIITVVFCLQIRQVKLWFITSASWTQQAFWRCIHYFETIKTPRAVLFCSTMSQVYNQRVAKIRCLTAPGNFFTKKTANKKLTSCRK